MSKPNPLWQPAFDNIEKGLPNRQLTLKNTGEGNVVTQLLVTVAVLIFAVFFFVLGVNRIYDIYTDSKITDNYVILDDVNVYGECSSRKLMSSCDIEIKYQDQFIKQKFEFVAMNYSTNTVEVLAQKDDPSNISTDVAVNHVKGRIYAVIFFIVLSLILLLLGAKLALDFPKKARIKKIMNDKANQPWHFVAHKVEYSAENMDFTTPVDGKEQSLMMSVDKPFILDNVEGNIYWVLAIRARNSDTVLPLTQKLKNIDFTPQERSELVNLINHELNL